GRRRHPCLRTGGGSAATRSRSRARSRRRVPTRARPCFHADHSWVLPYTQSMVHTYSMQSVKSRRSQHTADTRGALLKAARGLFGKSGYAAVSLDEVCARARVTKGALYHHFENKQDLFLGVYEQVEEDLLDAGTRAVPADADFWASLSLAGRAFLDVCARR